MSSIRKRGNRWQVQVRRKGQVPVSASFLHQKDAARWAREMEARADRGELVTFIRPGATLFDLLEIYLERSVARKRSAYVERYIIQKLQRQPFSTLAIDKLTPGPFAAYRDLRLEEVAPATVCRELGLLQHVFRLARDEWDWPIRENPLEKVIRPRLPSGRMRRLKPGEEEQLIRACNTAHNPWLLPATELALATAMRQGEILKACWSNLATDWTTLVIPETKNGHMREIPITCAAQNILKGLPRSEENSSTEMGRAMSNAYRLADAIGGLVVLIHHLGKENNRGPRGSSALYADVDTAVKVETRDNLISATLVKQRDGRDGLVFEAKIHHTVYHPVTGPQTLVPVVGDLIVNGSNGGAKISHPDLIMAILKDTDGEIEKTELRNKFSELCKSKSPHDAFRTAIRRLSDGKVIELEEKPRG